MREITIKLEDHLIAWLEHLVEEDKAIDRQAVADGVIQGGGVHTIEGAAAEMVERGYLLAVHRGTVPAHIMADDIPF